MYYIMNKNRIIAEFDYIKDELGTAVPQLVSGSLPEIYGDSTEKFIEEDGRKCFLVYLRPIINGVGNYYIEARTRDNCRMDVVIDYLGKRYIVELKIWHGPKYNEDGEKQLSDYLDSYKIKNRLYVDFQF